MVAMLLGLTVAAAICFFLFFVILRRISTAPLSWRILAWSGVPLALSGFGFASRFWHPSSGPFIANQLYPFGTHLDAWAVSFGFTWAAFALLFSGAVLLVSRDPRWDSWTLLLCVWLLCWWPHAIIGVGFAWNGANRQSLDIYRKWASDPIGAVVLLRSSIELVWHMTFSIAGFIGTARALSRGENQHALRT
jgi:hypothetical protein